METKFIIAIGIMVLIATGIMIYQHSHPNFLKMNTKNINAQILNGELKYDTIQSTCGTISSSGTYVLNQSISGGTNCLVIAASNAEIDCQGFNITFGTTGQGDGISNNNGYDNLTIRNCNIVLAVNRANSNTISLEGDNTDNYIGALFINNTLNVTATTSQTASRCLIITSNATNITIDKNNCYANNLAPGFGIALVDATTRKINIHITNNNIYGGTFGSNFNNVFEGGIIENNSFYQIKYKDGFSLDLPSRINNTLIINNRFYYGNNLTSGGVNVRALYLNNVSFINNYFEQFNYSILTYTINISNKTIGGIVFSNNTFNASYYYLNASTSYQAWNTTTGNYWTNNNSLGYSDLCSVTLQNYVCDLPFNVSEINNNDSIPKSWRTIPSGNLCWYKMNNVLVIPTGCVYNVSTGAIGG